MNAKELWHAMRQPSPRGNAPEGKFVQGYGWRWTYAHEGEHVPVTKQVATLKARGIVECTYYSGGEASANLTDKGRSPDNCPLRSGWPS